MGYWRFKKEEKKQITVFKGIVSWLLENGPSQCPSKQAK